jgi:hypothetical protein
MRIVISSIVLTLVLTGCASAGSAGGQRSNPNVITTAELRPADPEGLNVFQAIQRMRPQWLRGRGVATFTGGSELPRVLVEEAPFGEVDDLRSMDAYDIEELRFLSAADATTRFGTGYQAGVILVYLR